MTFKLHGFLLPLCDTAFTKPISFKPHNVRMASMGYLDFDWNFTGWSRPPRRNSWDSGTSQGGLGHPEEIHGILEIIHAAVSGESRSSSSFLF
ncbi:hypothetical protein ACFX2F_002579 [Malus domestica]